ncbi:MAG TPA: hypothetical protein VJA47_00625, partial [archaeon]|nr:hypothetical protein [archaeon]
RSRINFQQKLKGAEPVYRLEVPFDDRDYLKKLGEEAIEDGLVTGYTIETAETAFRWNGSVKEGELFVLRATVPNVGKAKLRYIYQFFYDGIGEMWVVPVVYIDSAISTNQEFVEWMKRQSKENPVVIEKVNNMKWKYLRNTTYINLFGGGNEEDEEENHILALVAPRRHGIIDVEQTKAFFKSPTTKAEALSDLDEAIREARGLSMVDRETLKRGKDMLSIIIPEDW